MRSNLNIFFYYSYRFRYFLFWWFLWNICSFCWLLCWSEFLWWLFWLSNWLLVYFFVIFDCSWLSWWLHWWLILNTLLLWWRFWALNFRWWSWLSSRRSHSSTFKWRITSHILCTIFTLIVIFYCHKTFICYKFTIWPISSLELWEN